MMKAYEIPVSKPVKKMLKRDYGYSKHLNITQMIFCSPYKQRNPDQIRQYIENTTDSQVRITVVCKYLSIYKLYTLSRMMENEFKTKMLLYIEAAVEGGMEATEAIRKFMDKYDISFEELEPDTAYKQWQRYKNKEQMRNILPLW
ncbi:hypothetical protein [Mongoliibacter ruber]|uniref:Uncharacterized protein n=1 Tax=Mongoliibacter ruber TaxID=1750599 RepID=A0A2T0WV63_9BACT|nr:hypothetical protein [Mongoliibacter ruber]PRY90593.1 hypothetical protein CLW00_101257 [Mongoliibacter ruber]